MQSLYRWKYLAYYNLTLGIVMSLPRFSIRKDVQDYGIDIAEVYIALVPLSIPWMIKFIPGICFDKYTLCGYNRKSYLVLACLLNAIVSLLFIIPSLNFGTYLLLCVLYQQTLVFWDVIIDSIMIEDSHKAEKEKAKGALFVLTVIFRGAGFAIGDSCGSLAWGDLGSDGVYMICFGILMLNSFIGTCMPDVKFRALFSRVASAGVSVVAPPAVSEHSLDEDVHILQAASGPSSRVIDLGWKYQWAEMKVSLSHYVLRRLLMFNIASMLIPSPGMVFFYFLNDEVEFTTSEMSILSLASQIIQFTVVLLYVWKIKFYGIRLLYTITAFLSIGAGILPLFLVIQVPVSDNTTLCGYSHTTNTSLALLGDTNRTYVPRTDNETQQLFCYYYQYHAINPMYLALSDDVLGEIVDVIRNMPMTMVLIAVCGKNVEASVYSSVLGLLNVMGLFRKAFDYIFVNAFGIKRGYYKNFGPFLLFCVGIELFVCLFIVLIPNDSVPKIEAEATEELRKLAARMNNTSEVTTECRQAVQDIIDRELRSSHRAPNKALETMDTLIVGGGLVGRRYSTSDSHAVV